MRQFAVLALLFWTRCAVHAVPLHARGVMNALDPLKSVASDLFGSATVPGGLFPGAEATTLSQYSPIAPSSLSPTASKTNAAESSGIATFGVSSATDASKTSKISPTGSISKVASSINPLAITAGASGSQASPSGPSTTDAVNPITTTGGGGSSSSRPGSGSASASGSASGSGSGSGAGSSSSQESRKSSSLSPGQAAAAVILPVLALVGATLALVLFCPPVRRRYETWRQERLESRAYRRALDDPVMSFGGREQALGLGDGERLMHPLSFGFSTPQREGIRRKPLEWGAARIGSDRASAIGMAVPLGEHRRTISDISEESDRAPSPYEDARSDQT